MRRWRYALLLAAAATAQQPAPADPADAAVAALRARWSDARQRGQAMPDTERRRDIELLLAVHGDGSRASLRRLRLELADLHLRLLATRAAQTQFDRVAAEVAPGETDLRGQALLGAGLCRLALGQREPARELLRELADALPGTRYATHAEAALRRIDERRPPARAGDPLPSIPRLLDLAGRPRELGATRTGPALIVCWSPDLPESVEALARAARVWAQQGLPPEQITALGIAADAELLRETLRAQGLATPVVPCPQGALDPAVVALGIDSLPALLLIGRDGTILARDFPAGQLADLLRQQR